MKRARESEHGVIVPLRTVSKPSPRATRPLDSFVVVAKSLDMAFSTADVQADKSSSDPTNAVTKPNDDADGSESGAM